MNTNTQGYFSKTDNESLGYLFDSFKPKNNAVWFLEKRNTEEWLTADHTLTKNPIKCLHFQSKIAAFEYIIHHDLMVHNYEPTEHLFVEDKHK